MRQVWEDIKYFFTRDWTMAEKVLIIICCILLGMVKGFLIAPIKKGISCGNSCATTYNHCEDDED